MPDHEPLHDTRREEKPDENPNDPRAEGGNPDQPGHDGEFDGTTRLFIRTHPADDGSQPLAPGLQFWTSPDIAIVKPGGGVGGEAVPLQLNHVRVTVTNGGGIPAVDAYVDAFVADPSTVITPGTATFIGGGILTVQGHMQETIDLPWTPQAGDTGHRCIIARVSMVFPLDTYVDPTVFDVIGDRHVAQRNIQVLEIAAGKAMSFRFRLGPVAGKRKASVRVVERTWEMDARALAQAGGCSGGLPAVMPLSHMGVRALSGREALGRPSLVGDKPPSLGVTRRHDDLDQDVEFRVDGRGAKQGRVASLTLAVSGDDEPGRLHAVDVEHLDAETGEVLGGLSFIVRVR